LDFLSSKDGQQTAALNSHIRSCVNVRGRHDNQQGGQGVIRGGYGEEEKTYEDVESSADDSFQMWKA
jgi:hypothetical protein